MLYVFVTVTDVILSSKLLEAIRAITNDEKKEVAAGHNFQEAVTIPTDRAVDEQASALPDLLEMDAEIQADHIYGDEPGILV